MTAFAALRLTLLIGIATLAGWFGEQIDIPLPWIIGPMLVSTAAGLAGYGIGESRWIRRGAQVVIGTTVGHTLSASILFGLLSVLPFMIAAALISIFIAVLASELLAKQARLDRRTALLANLPGGVAEMAFLGDGRAGASTAIALIQAMRVSSIVLVIPPILTFFVTSGEPTLGYELGHGRFDWALGLILVLGWFGGLGLSRFGIKNAFVVSALAISLVDTMIGFPGATVPTILFIVAQISIGLALGARFRREDVMRLPRLLGIGLLLSLITSAVIIGVVLGLAVVIGLDLDLATMALAVAPGGIAEMVITAAALGLGVPEVVMFQTVRIIVVNMLAGWVADGWVRWRSPTASAD